MSFGFPDSWFFLKVSLNLSLCKLSFILPSGTTQECPNFHVKALQVPKRGCPAFTSFSLGSSSPSHPPPHTPGSGCLTVSYSHSQHGLHVMYLCKCGSQNRTRHFRSSPPVDCQGLNLQWIWRIPERNFFHTGRGSRLSFLSFPVITQILVWINYGSSLLC